MQNKFTQKAQNTLKAALAEAGKLGHPYVGSEHLLLALISQTDCIASKILLSRGLSVLIVRTALSELVGTGEPCRPTPQDLTPHARNIIESASVLAEEKGCTYIGTEHLLLALLLCEDCTASNIIKRTGLSSSVILCDISAGNNSAAVSKAPEKSVPEQKKRPSHSVLSLYSKDLCELAESGRCERLIGRDAEIERTLGILCRRNKNNPCLIGEPGVGKTAIVEGLAARIVSGDVPKELLECRILSLDISSMLAGAKYRGEFEERMKNVLAEIDKHPELILFIDELHVIVGAGSAEGAVDAGNILKPALARGGIRVIGATTLSEYQKHIEKDAALCRRFGVVRVEEPTEQETVTLLDGIRESYETHHDIDITHDAIQAAVSYSVRYITDRFLPDKAIDLIDESAAQLHLTVTSNASERPILTREHIAHTVSRLTGISEEKILGTGKSLLHFDTQLKGRIIGQDEAVDAVCSAVLRGSVGLSDTSRPLGVFIFIGRSGVGKSALAEAVAEELFGSRRALLKFDMSEYSEQHSVSKLVGSPPGYVGYGEGGLLTERVHRRPYSVVLLDEIEKAHPDIFNLLLPIIEDGKISDSRGMDVDFRNTVIIMTSNAGAAESEKIAGFGGDKNDSLRQKQDMHSALKRLLPPEFLNRVDEIVVFNELSFDAHKAIAKKMLTELVERAKAAGLTLTVEDGVADQVAKQSFSQNTGARSIRRIIAKQIEDMLADAIINKRLEDHAVLSVDNGSFVCQ